MVINDRQLPSEAIQLRSTAIERLQDYGFSLPDLAKNNLAVFEHGAQNMIAVTLAMGQDPGTVLSLQANVTAVITAINWTQSLGYMPKQEFYGIQFGKDDAEGAEADDAAKQVKAAGSKDPKVKVLTLITAASTHDTCAMTHGLLQGIHYAKRTEDIMDPELRKQIISHKLGAITVKHSPHDRVVKVIYTPVIKGVPYPDMAVIDYGIHLQEKITPPKPDYPNAKQPYATKFGLAVISDKRTGSDIALKRGIRITAKTITQELYPKDKRPMGERLRDMMQMANQEAIRIEDVLSSRQAENVEDAIEILQSSQKEIDPRDEMLNTRDAGPKEPRKQTEMSSSPDDSPIIVGETQAPPSVEISFNKWANRILKSLPEHQPVFEALAKSQKLDTKPAQNGKLLSVRKSLTKYLSWEDELSIAKDGQNKLDLILLSLSSAEENVSYSDTFARVIGTAIVAEYAGQKNSAYDNPENVVIREIIGMLAIAIDEELG